MEAFETAIEMKTEERSAFLAKVGSDDPSLRSEVESLLAEDARQAKAPPGAIRTATLVGQRIGTYQIARLIGEGGMGVVYEAQQDQPRRVVALKVLKPGLANAELLRRFGRESEVLARLQHPGIAQIYEAGTAETGFGPQPFFAMELIHGRPLRDYAESHALNTRQRLDLMARVCDAVEHAHLRGIIHRDLKPANILVDEAGQPKILDFGVARATDSDAHVTRQTDVGQLVGTLAYMSPEQVLADPLELDTRSDVYALGVILYELLANRLPYLLSNKLDEAVRSIREEDPTRLSSINRAYRGDVETIVAKALEKDKTRRYSSAAALAGDIRRYLADEPITARPASTSYQLWKFTRRHTSLVIAAAVIFAVLVAATVVSTREAVRARQAEQTAQAVNDFLQNDLLAQASAATQSRPNSKPDPDLKVRTALDRAAARIAGKFGQQPQVEAAIRDTIGETYADLGLYPEAQTELQRALDLYRNALGAENPTTLKTVGHLGRLAFLQGAFPQAEALFSRSLEMQRRVLGPEHPDTLISMHGLANVYNAEGKYPQGEALVRQALEMRRRVLGPDHPDTLASMSTLANVTYYEGKYPEAEALFRQLLEMQRHVLGPEHPATLKTMSNLASIYGERGKYAQAEALGGQALEIRRRVLGPEHPDTLASIGNLGWDDYLDGKYSEAESLERQALEMKRRVLGPDHPDTLLTMNSLANVYDKQGKYPQAEALYAAVLEIRRRVLGPDHPDTRGSMIDLAFSYGLEGKYPQAEALFRTAMDISRRVLGPGHPRTLNSLALFSYMYQRQGKFGIAEAYSTQVLAGLRRARGSEHPYTIEAALNLALAQFSQGKFAESEPLAREVVEFGRNKQLDDWLRFRAETLLGAILARQRKFAEAEPLLLNGYGELRSRKERIGAPEWYHLDRAHEWIIQLYQAWGKPEKAAEWRAKMVAHR